MLRILDGLCVFWNLLRLVGLCLLEGLLCLFEVVVRSGTEVVVLLVVILLVVVLLVVVLVVVVLVVVVLLVVVLLDVVLLVVVLVNTLFEGLDVRAFGSSSVIPATADASTSFDGNMTRLP